MPTCFRFAAFIAVIISFCACSQKQPTRRPLSGIIDKEVWHVTDSLTKNNIFANDSTGASLLLLRQLKRFPDWKDSATHAWLLLQSSEIYGYYGPLDSLEAYCEQALGYFENHPEYPLPLNMCYAGIGFSILNLNGNVFKANYYCTKAASLCLLPGADTIFPPGLILRSLTAAANSNHICNQDRQALRFSLAANRKSYAMRHTWDESYLTSLLDLAKDYMQLDQLDSAYLYLKKAESWYDSVENKAYSPAITYCWSSYYYFAKQYDSSLHYSLALSKVEREDRKFGSMYNNALLYSLVGKQAEAKKCLDIAGGLLGSVKNDAERKGYTATRTFYQIKYGDRNDAANSFLEYQDLVSKFYNNEQSQISLAIESEYNLTEKQKNLDKLSLMNENAKKELKARNNLLLITGLVLLLCAAIIVALLLLSRQRKLRAQAKEAESQRKKIALEQRLLRTQMEPHFIFNTLASMQYFIHQNENEKANLYLTRFSRLLRNSLEHSREEYVLVSEEIDTLEDYISLQAMRSGDSFDYIIKAYDGYKEDNIKIPPMLLQPFVENAIFHGMNNIERKGQDRKSVV